MCLPLHAFAPAGHPGSPAAVRPGGSGFGSSCRGAAAASAGARCPDLPVRMGGPPARKRPLSTPVGAPQPLAARMGEGARRCPRGHQLRARLPEKASARGRG